MSFGCFQAHTLSSLCAAAPRAGAARGWGPEPRRRSVAKRFPGWGACAGFVEVPLEITSRCCRAELGPGGELVFKQILILVAAVGDEGASSHLAVNSAWLQRSCHGAQSGGGKTLLVSRGSGAKPRAGSSSRWQRLCSSPAGLRGREGRGERSRQGAGCDAPGGFSAGRSRASAFGSAPGSGCGCCSAVAFGELLESFGSPRASTGVCRRLQSSRGGVWQTKGGLESGSRC